MRTLHANVRAGVMAAVMAIANTSLAVPYVVPDAWSDTAAADVAPGGVLRLSTAGTPRTFNPLISVERNLVVSMNTDWRFGAAVLGWPRPDDSSLEPRAAESWSVSADGLKVDVTLRPELRWSDGVPITAQDYLISYQLQIDPEAAAAGPEAWTVGEALVTVEATGTHTLRVRFPAADRLAMQLMASHYPLPDHIFGRAYRTGGAEAVKALWGTATPPADVVFSGSMRLKEVREGERLTFERNPYFGDWTVDEAGLPLPYLDGVTYAIMEPATEQLMADLARRGRTTLDDEEALGIARELLELEVELSAMIYTVVPVGHLIRSTRVRGDFPRELWSPRTGFGWVFMNSVL